MLQKCDGDTRKIAKVRCNDGAACGAASAKLQTAAYSVYGMKTKRCDL